MLVGSRIRALTVLAPLATLLAVHAPAPAGASEPVPIQVEIVSRAYQPGGLTVGVGQQVVWKNESFGDHTVTSTEELFNSGVMDPTSTFAFTFTKPGTYDYSCTIHPTMKGSVLVLALAPNTVAVKASGRQAAHGHVTLVHVEVARADVAIQLQAQSHGSWSTVARSVTGSTGQASLSLKGPKGRHLRVVVAAADGAPRIISHTLRAP